MAAGTSFGIVPFMSRLQLAVVFALVGVARSLSVVTATADADSTNVEAGLRSAIAGFGMLVGICWKKAFETALGGHCDGFHNDLRTDNKMTVEALDTK